MPALSVLDNVFLGVELGAVGVVDRGAAALDLRELAERIGFEHSPVDGASRRCAWPSSRRSRSCAQLVRDARLIVHGRADRGADPRRGRPPARDHARAAHRRRDCHLRLARPRRRARALRHRHRAQGRTPREDDAGRRRDADSLVTAMLGRSMDLVFPAQAPPPADAPVVLSVRGLSPAAGLRRRLLRRAGRARSSGSPGLVGSGRTEIARAIFGADPAEGTIEIDGRELTRAAAGDGIRRGLALLPESRKDQGLVMIRPVRENVSMAHLDEVSWHGVVQLAPRARARRGRARRSSTRAPPATRCPSPHSRAATSRRPRSRSGC